MERGRCNKKKKINDSLIFYLYIAIFHPICTPPLVSFIFFVVAKWEKTNRFATIIKSIKIWSIFISFMPCESKIPIIKNRFIWGEFSPKYFTFLNIRMYF